MQSSEDNVSCTFNETKWREHAFKAQQWFQDSGNPFELLGVFRKGSFVQPWISWGKVVSTCFFNFRFMADFRKGFSSLDTCEMGRAIP